MGVSRNFSYGYGVIIEPNEELERDAEKVLDIEAFLEEQYPLLVDGYAGYGYDTLLVFVRSTVMDSFEKLLLPIEIKDVTDEERHQLDSFLTRFNIQQAPQWYACCAIGDG